ncbi:hypothetical protein A4D02_35500 [Niastella koreensis]|uniref:Uncharacterized protein n=2 Tax=Niastella koreensis TaxID=354356 RepID=G8TJF4_NIAKG|nr:hypothetical protein [Niastella koreensis]AEV99689.1 hypothetical protein Niako_3382 [Niastella koreensis GR20-10]OQP44283.1 hypothetical protein A4D02_35500 [Niastella koreensis]
MLNYYCRARWLLSNARKIQKEHIRVVKTIEPKKRGGRHDFPKGLEEQIIILDADDKPANARCIGHVDQRQLACDPMRLYIKVNRRLVYMVPRDTKDLQIILEYLVKVGLLLLVKSKCLFTSRWVKWNNI